MGLDVANPIGFPAARGSAPIVAACWLSLSLASVQFVYPLFTTEGDSEIH